MTFNVDVNVILQALIVAGTVWIATTLSRTAARLATHEAMDDLRFQYIEEKLGQYDERIDRIEAA
jgi:hypothetical protein